ncbi:MAG: metallophosphoesterase family protein, partial [Oscillospiraceae bacterium]|nr:metallophosphoesterase family protein [Oscillospiraceae bacterium]
FFLTHGHTYRVKYGFDAIINAACVARADVLLFGHTHTPYYADVNGLTVINPGSIGYGDTYGVLTIENGSLNYEMKRIW